MEVCPLSRGVILPVAQLLSAPLQSGFRFFHLPLPALPSARLAACFPSSGEVRVYHVPQFRPDGTGLAYTPVAQRLR